MQPRKSNLQSNRTIRQTLLLSVAILGVAVSAFSKDGRAAEVIRLRGKGASAIFSSSDSSQCIDTTVYIQFGESTIKNPPALTQQVSIAAVFISQYDFCTGTQLIEVSSGDFPLPAGSAHVDKHLDSATLNATIEAFDDLNNLPVSVEVQLNWISTNEPPFRNRGYFHFQSADTIFTSRSRSTSRSADVSGTVLLGANNLTPQPTTGQVESAIAAQVTINRH